MTQLMLDCRHVERSAALESSVRESLRRLERLNDRIDRCRLTVEGPVPEAGNSSYLVRIELNLPGARINAGNRPQGPESHTDMYRALREAFEDAKRQLQSLRWDH